MLVDTGEKNMHHWAAIQIERGFSAIEKLLENTMGNYCIGDNVSLADCCLIPQYYNAIVHFKISSEKFTKINIVYSNLQKLPFFVMAKPEGTEPI